MAAKTLPILPARWLVKDKFDNAKKATGLSLPVLIVHGTEDEIIPLSMGQRLQPAFPTATLYEVSGGNHNDLFVRDGRIIVDRIVEFATAQYGGR